MFEQIIVGDCLDTLKKFINDNHKVDYIFGDLTDIPISKSTQSDLTWSFIKVIMKMSFEVLNPKGKFMTHVSDTIIIILFIFFICIVNSDITPYQRLAWLLLLLSII